MYFFTLALLSGASAASLVPRGCTNPAPKVVPKFAPGYSGNVVFNNLKSPRGLVLDSLGNVLVVEQNVGVRLIVLTSGTGSNVCSSKNSILIKDTSLNHGIALSSDSKTLFVSSADAVYSYPYNAGSGTVGNGRKVISGMANADHTTRTLLIAKSQPNKLLVSRGSNANNDTGAAQLASGRAQIRTFTISDMATGPAIPYTSGQVLGWGLRNSVGIGEHPKNGGIWSVENSVDNLFRNGVDIHQTNPCEELNYHGTLRTPSRETGANFGYPTCFAAFNRATIPLNTNLQTGTQFAVNAADDASCRDKMAPRLCFPAHNAPLGIKFKADGTRAYVTFHGSWNRQPPDGYRVSVIGFDPNTGMPTAPSTSTTAATQIMYNSGDLSQCPGACFRPVDLAWDNKGRLFMTSDATGELWVIGGA